MKKTQKTTKQNKPVVEKSKLEKKAKFAKTGYILGIVAICASIFMIGGLVGIPGIVFSAIGSKSPDPRAKKWSKIGLILSIIGLAIGITLFFVFEFVLIDIIYQWGGHPGGY